MRAILLLGVAVLLAGCQTKDIREMSYSEKKALAQQIVQRCVDQGVKPGTQEMRLCTNTEILREDYKRKNAPRLEFNPAGAATALQGVSQGYYRSAAAMSANNTTTCTTVPSPAGMTKVRCY